MKQKQLIITLLCLLPVLAAGGLLLTHFSTSMEDPEAYLPEARAVFERTWTAADGGTVTMRYPEKEEKAWISLC